MIELLEVCFDEIKLAKRGFVRRSGVRRGNWSNRNAGVVMVNVWKDLVIYE